MTDDKLILSLISKWFNKLLFIIIFLIGVFGVSLFSINFEDLETPSSLFLLYTLGVSWFLLLGCFFVMVGCMAYRKVCQDRPEPL